MGKCRLARKLNNESGKSIFMALFLLLVCVVVSVVIVTVAVTSVMHVDDNKTSNQEYLACESAARLINDCLEEKKYTHTTIVGTYTYNNGWSSESYTPDPTESLVKGNLASFANTLSRAIKNDDGTSSKLELESGSFDITQDEMYKVSATYNLAQSSTEETLASGEKVKKYSLVILLETQNDEDSHGYRMKMTIPVTRSIPKATEGKLQNVECQRTGRNKHSYKHTFDTTTTTVTVTWSAATISEGWS